MTHIKVFPGKLNGNVQVPASKSLAHRGIICAALGAGASKVMGLGSTQSEDIQATLAGMMALGALVESQEDHIQIIGSRRADDREKWADKFGAQSWRLKSQETANQLSIDCNESGSTLRFLLPLALTRVNSTRFIGRGNLGQRPLAPYFNIFQEQGIRFERLNPEKGLDLTVTGTLKPGKYKLPGDISSQFISGLLFALPLLKEDSHILLTTPLESKSYLEMTLKTMRDFGVKVGKRGDQEYFIEGRQRYQSCDVTIEGDYSQAAFFLVAGALGSEVGVRGLAGASLQGDRIILDYLQRMGAVFSQGEQSLIARPTKAGLQATLIDGAQCPDIIPILAAAAALSEGTTEIINAGRLRLKECDRLSAITIELNKLGAQIIENPDGLTIRGVPMLRGGTQVWSHGDHRIAMTLAVAATCCQEPIVIEDSDCVAKSYPNFWLDYQQLGGKIMIERRQVT